jgi:hypothetical protein
MPVKKIRSKDYLDFIGQQKCVVTGSHPADCHHESVTRRFSAGMKKYFDFGALPLRHDVHLYERHSMGKVEFWEKYNLNPAELAVNFIEEYLSLAPEDYDVAEEALYMIKRDNGL